MRDLFAHPAFRKLFGAQAVALVGTGLLTVALALLAFDLAGEDAGIVLGIALTTKVVAYVILSPVMTALTEVLPRRLVLVSADLVRAAVALSLPLVAEVWHIYALVFVLQAASATFTPTFQGLIPEILPDEREYTLALSLSRLAYDLEALLSPVLAAGMLLVLDYNSLFLGTCGGFIGSALLVMTSDLPPRKAGTAAGFGARLTAGARIFVRSPELRCLLAMNLVVAAATAMVMVNTVVLVRGDLQRGDGDVAILLAAFGVGSMVVALLVPGLLDRSTERGVMLAGTVLQPALLAAVAGVMVLAPATGRWPMLMLVWLGLGAATSLVLTPASRLVRRAAGERDASAAFATQFSASHACYVLTYPVAGLFGAQFGLPITALVLGGMAAVGALLATAAAHSARPVLSERRAGGTLPRLRGTRVNARQAQLREAQEELLRLRQENAALLEERAVLERTVVTWLREAKAASVPR